MKTIAFNQARFLTSAAKLSQLPVDQGAEVAFAGRSNVGKSSALNTLTQQRGLARTSKTPGRTQLINFFSINEHIRLVDLPGYGYAKVPLETKKRWEQTLAQYLETRQCLKGLILLVDMRHPAKPYDEMMIQWADHFQLPLHILLTKADKLSRSQAIQTLQQWQKDLAGFNNVSIQRFSSLKKQGVSELEGVLSRWYLP